MNIIDLSHTLKNNMQVYPGDASPYFTKVFTHEKDGIQATRMTISTHHGTHLDCPLHFISNGSTTENSGLDNFFTKALLINCTGFGSGAMIPARHFYPLKEALNNVSWAIIYTGWYRYWGSDEYLRNFPVLSVEATQFLLEQNIKGIGLDVISIDTVESQDFPNHNLTLGSGIFIIENLTNLYAITSNLFTLAAFPLKIHEGDGSPLRAVAIVE
jgi:arylformamidase